MNKTALITGITGQDGAYLAQLLLSKNYKVCGIIRPSSVTNTKRLERLLNGDICKIEFHYADMTDGLSLMRVIQETKPDEIYNLAAQSHVKMSFDIPEYTANTNALGTLRLLEAIKHSGLMDNVRFYQASTSEIFGNAKECPQTETTPFHPRSPYGIAKLHAYWSVVNFRESYGMHASNGILFNHESPLRGDAFVSQKIVKAVIALNSGKAEKLVLGNLQAQRDWGHAKDYVVGMWLMLTQDMPDDYILASGHTRSVRSFVEKAFSFFNTEIVWQGQGIDEKGYDRKTEKLLIEVNPELFRPAEVDYLLGDASKAKKKLNWQPKISFDALVQEMLETEMKNGFSL